MKKISSTLLGLSLVAVGVLPAIAQEPASMPKILQITREFTKPYKGGAAHDKTESAFVQAQVKANFPAYYFAVNSMTGKARELFLTPYASFENWGKDNEIASKNKILAGELERAGLADGELLDSVESQVYTYSEELSYHPHPDLSHARFLEISVFHVRLGHDADWDKLSKEYRNAMEKSGSSAHWAMYELAYGAESGTYIALSSRNSMAEIDTNMMEGPKFLQAMGEDGMKNFMHLYGETVDTAHTELFSINPLASYVSEDTIKADPSFWKPKPAAVTAAKPAAETKKSTR
jgi:hypothetical protein